MFKLKITGTQKVPAFRAVAIQGTVEEGYVKRNDKFWYKDKDTGEKKENTIFAVTVQTANGPTRNTNSVGLPGNTVAILIKDKKVTPMEFVLDDYLYGE